MHKIFEIDLDIKNPSNRSVPQITVVSGDTDSNQFDINLFENFQPVNATGNNATIIFKKPDNTTVYQNLTVVDASKGKFRCFLSSQTIAVPGTVKAEVALYEGTTRLTTTRFEFRVSESLLNEDAVESSNEFSALTEAVAKVDNMEQTLNAHLEDNENPHPIYAKKAWNDYIDATLINGWTGTLKYAKNDLGEVHLKGLVTAGTVNLDTVIANLAVGYRPEYQRQVPLVVYNISTGKIETNFIINDTGNIVIRPPANITAGNQIAINAIFRIA